MASLSFIAIIFMMDVFFMTNHFLIKKLRHWTNELGDHDKFDEIDMEKDDLKWLKRLGFVKACLTGTVHKEINSNVRFYRWEPIPYKAGLISTGLLLIITCVLMTPAFLEAIGVDSSVSGGSNLCETDNFASEIDKIDTRFDELSNLPLVRKQYDHTKLFHDALLNDTSLYGEAPVCTDITSGGETLPGNKASWQDFSTFPASQYGTFFPGYCGAARQLALENAQNKKCTQRKCVCGQILDNCFEGATQHCFDFEVPCPAHTNDEQEALDNYRYAQLLNSANRDAQNEALKNEVKEVAEDTSESAAESFGRIMFQVDIAGTMYVLYIALSLFFPSPLVVFRTGIAYAFRRTFFGADKTTFIVVVIALWWGFYYFEGFFIDPEMELYIKNILSNPCFADTDFIRTRENLISSKCEELVPKENDWRILSTTIDQTIAEVTTFHDSCGSTCAFPTVHLNELNSIPTDFTDEIGFTRNFVFIPARVQKTDFEFLGNSTICTNRRDTERELFEDPDAEVNFFEIWIGSGVLASIFVKISMSNFCVALLRLADPLSFCGGLYEQPPKRFKLGDKEDRTEFREMKENILKTIAFRSAIIWGGIFNLVLFNLYATLYNQDFDVTDTSDIVSFMIIMMMATLFPVLLLCASRRLDQRIEYNIQNGRPVSLRETINPFYSVDFRKMSNNLSVDFRNRSFGSFDLNRGSMRLQQFFRRGSKNDNPMDDPEHSL